MSEQTPSDRELARRVVAGDEEGWRLIYDRFFDVLSRDAFRRLGNRDDAEDAVQETFTRFFRYLSGFDPERNSLRAYLLGILQRVCLDIYRRKKERSQRPWGEYTEEPAAPEREEPLFAPDELKRFWEKVAAVCDSREREILALNLKGLRNKEIAIALGLEESTVSSYLCAIKKKASNLGPPSV